MSWLGWGIGADALAESEAQAAAEAERQEEERFAEKIREAESLTLEELGITEADLRDARYGNEIQTILQIEDELGLENTYENAANIRASLNLEADPYLDHVLEVPPVEQIIDLNVYDLDVPDHVPATPDVPEVDDIPLEIALVVGFEETATSGQVHVYYQPTQELEDNEDDDELT